MIREICVWIVTFMMIVFGSLYAYQVRKREINPALSTWIIFLLGTGLSLTTYIIAEKHDLRSGILNMTDTMAVIIALVAIILYGNRNMRFRPFERWYLCGVAAIVAYGLWSGDAWGSNIFTQVLIAIGYLPTIQKLLTEKRNTESFTAWGCNNIASLIALYPAIVNGNSLAVMYASRSFVLTLSTIGLMAYYELRLQKKQP
ncbi:MAG: hypothetical protein JW740_03060 [Candidatus Zambryskibacteria bacterium]|nr:hypothetical protein [Candidatus Zambryskibacteria bacterium]